jgi:hypothetical protein
MGWVFLPHTIKIIPFTKNQCMNRNFIFIFIVLSFIQINLLAQFKVSLSGFVTDIETGEVLINATIVDHQNRGGVVANNYGFFTIKVDANETVKVECSFVGYQPMIKDIRISRDTIINFKLKKGIEIEEIVINNGLNYLHKTQHSTGVIKMDATLAGKLPTLLGEADLARMLQLMPGVQSGKEGSGGLYVRGGTNDQNLVLLDGMPVYNANHIGGFVSIFNPSSVSHLKLYKGGFPAKYGGRLSSILEVRMKNGNMQKKEGSISIGTLTSSFSYEFPLKKDTSSLIIAGRRTVFDLFVSAYNYLDAKDDSDGGYNLWDINVKYNKKLNDRTRIYFSFYNGRDKIFRSGKEEYTIEETVYNDKRRYENSWGNTTTSFRLNKVYSTKIFANFTLGISNFNYKIEANSKVKKLKELVSSNQTSFVSAITDYLLSSDYEHQINKNHALQYGLQGTIHQFSPSENEMKRIGNATISNDSIWGADNVIIPELALYVSDVYTINKKMSVDIGLRNVTYFIKDKTINRTEPRIVGNYELSKNISIKTSFSEMSQFTHLISTSDQALPSDFWLPSTEAILPEHSSQFSLGAFMSFSKKHEYEMSVDAYYKTMGNLVEIKGGTSFIRSGENWEDQILANGRGKVWGAEFLFEKKTGKTTGWIAYTLSKNMRKFKGINNNEWFPFRYDRRHELSIVVCHEINDHVNFSANWVFMSGEAATLPQFKYLIETQQFDNEDDSYGTYGEVYSYNGRNSFRTPSYHRLDFSFNFVKELNYGTRTWSLGLYNAYNQNNPYYLFIGKNKTGETKLYSFSFFPIMPSVSYSYKF